MKSDLQEPMLDVLKKLQKAGLELLDKDENRLSCPFDEDTIDFQTGVFFLKDDLNFYAIPDLYYVEGLIDKMVSGSVYVEWAFKAAGMLHQEIPKKHYRYKAQTLNANRTLIDYDVEVLEPYSNEHRLLAAFQLLLKLADDNPERWKEVCG